MSDDVKDDVRHLITKNSQRLIDSTAKWIIDKIRDGTLYGMPFDETNQAMLIVMAYYIGKVEGEDDERRGIPSMFRDTP